jgi:hypothetical protein
LKASIGVLAATVGILLSQLAVAAAFLGIGLAFRRRWKLPTSESRDLVIAGWMGFGLTTAFLIAWQFFLPITAWATALVLIAGFAGLVWSREVCTAVVVNEPWLLSKRLGLALGASTLAVAYLCRGPILNQDTGLYHLQGVLWAKSYAVMPGLANLFGPLAFNNASLLYDAMLDVGPWSGRAHHIANGLIVQLLFIWAITSLAKTLHSVGRKHDQALLEGFFLIPAVSIAMHGWLTSYATDLPSVAMQFALLAQAHHLLLTDDEATGPDGAYTLVTMAILGTAAVAFKLSAAVIVASTLALCTAWWYRGGPSPERFSRTMGEAVGATVLFGGLWTARGILMSGYPLFPMPALGAPVAWRAPLEHAQAEYAFAAHSARASTEIPAVVLGKAGVEAWFPHWLSESAALDPYMVFVPLALLIACLAGLLASQTPKALPAYRPKWLFGPLGIALTTWFLAAPAPRYAFAIAWTMAALGWVLMINAWSVGHGQDASRFALTAVALLGLAPLLIVPLFVPRPRIRALPAIERILRTDLLLPGRGYALYPKPVVRPARTIVTVDGLTIRVPEERCWDTPLPCTPNPAPNLRLRTPGDLQSGFFVEGPWQMEDWPNRMRRSFGKTWQAKSRSVETPGP